jgi:replication factor A1
MTIKDDGGEIRVSFWNDDCQELKKVRKGNTVALDSVRVKKSGEFKDLNFQSGSSLSVKEETEKNVIKLSELKKDLQDVNCYARVARIFSPNTFERKDGSTGKVATVILNDGVETRLGLWDEQAEWTHKLDLGDVVKIEGGYVKENRGNLELHLGWKGRILRNPPGAPSLPEVKVEAPERKNVGELEPGNAEIRAVVVQAFPPTTLEVCSQCGKKAVGECSECKAPTKKTLILNSELDDGTGVIRGVFFREVAEDFLGVRGEDYQETKPSLSSILGTEKVFQGKVKHNDRFDREEFIVRRFKNVDLDEEIKKMKN